jgi:hypothetical protein
LALPNGDVYVGGFLDDCCHGQGTLTFGKGLTEGDKYTGTFANGKRSGPGKYQWANGDVFEGQFDDGIFHGEGVIKFGNGSKFEGNFVHGECPSGKMTFSDGSIYTGSLNGGRPDGKGMTTSRNGTIINNSGKSEPKKSVASQQASQPIAQSQKGAQKARK